jgi:predicted HTH domain antitoxin
MNNDIDEMSVLITDDIIQLANMPEEEFKLELGIFLYSRKILTLGKASEFVGIPQLIFQQELAKREISVSYDQEEFEKDLAEIRKKYGKS